MLLDVQHIAKSYDGIDILTDVSFHLEEKQKAAIVGINGAGKTTLLRQIVGEEEPDRGNIIFDRYPREPERRRTWQTTHGARKSRE